MESRIAPSRGEPTSNATSRESSHHFSRRSTNGRYRGSIHLSVRVRCPQTLCQSRDAALPNAILGPLECEIYPSTNHAKVVVWTIHYIPTKIVYPADMRCQANFDASAKLADSPRFTGLFSPNSSHANRGETARTGVFCGEFRLFAAAKNAATTCEDVRR